MISDYNFIVDSHCHLDLLEERGEDLDKIIANAQENKVLYLQTICTKITEFEKIYSYTQKYKNVFASAGIHPNNAQIEPEITIDDLLKLCAKEKVIGIGETGLDYHYQDSSREKQKENFLKHIKAAQISGLPLIIHNRNSDDDMAEILATEMKKKKFKALLHCFSSSDRLAKIAIELGIYISISGIVTFKNALALQEIVKIIPLDFLLLETDSPYLAPMPYRGKINQPAFTKYIGEFIANLKQIEAEIIAQTTSKNFFDLFVEAEKF